MDNIKNYIFYSEEAKDFLTVFRTALLDNEKIINQFADMVKQGNYDKVLVSLEERQGSSKWNNTVSIKYECMLNGNVNYKFISAYTADYKRVE